MRAGPTTIKIDLVKLPFANPRVEHQKGSKHHFTQRNRLWIRNTVTSGTLLSDVYEYGLAARDMFFTRAGNTTTERPDELAKLAPTSEVEISLAAVNTHYRRKSNTHVLTSIKCFEIMAAGPRSPLQAPRDKTGSESLPLANSPVEHQKSSKNHFAQC